MNKYCKEKLKRTKQKKGRQFYDKISSIFYNFTGHSIKSILSFEGFVNLMHKEVDAASLGIGRMLFGVMMILDIPEERGGSDLDLRWGESKDCHFPLFSFIKPLPLAKMGLVYFLMWLGALGIAFGYKFKSSCLTFVLTYWYIFLLDKSSWNNHTYLYGLVAFLLLFTKAHHFCSIDAWRNEHIEARVPFWNYFLLKFQFFILYFIAGLKKFSPEWLEGNSMSYLSHHWIFFPFKAVLGAELTSLLIIHWFATLFDTTIVFFLIYRRTRVIATLFSLAFHLMNSRLFNIGMFPFVCIAELVLFFEFDFPRTFLAKLKCFASEKLVMKRRLPLNEERIAGKCTFKEKFTTFLILIYCCLQLFLPYSHFITKGYNNWRHLYGYSWDMMMSEWSTMLVTVRIVDNGNNQQHLLEPLAFTDSYRWTQYPDMTYQYCQCINQNLIHDFRENSESILTSDNFSIFFDIWCSLNGRFQQRIYNPTIDILRSDWHPFKEPSFILPLLNEYSYLRKEIEEITNHVYSWNNYTDLLFIADFPGLTMDNYILPQMDNVTLTVLKGVVKFEYEDGVHVSYLSQGQRINVRSGEFHKVTTISDQPACYYYTYLNATRQLLNAPFYSSGRESQMKVTLPIWQEILARYENYKKFLYHIANSLLFEFYSVPMPRRLREIHDV